MILRCLVFAVILVSSTQAQITSGGIQGRTSFHGKYLTNVQIVLSNPLNGTNLTTSSNDLGFYQLVNLTPSNNYCIRFYTAYTDTLLLENIEVFLGKIQSIDISLRSAVNLLEPVLVKSTIEYYKENNLLQLNSKQIAQIPSSGGDYTKLIGVFPQAFIKESANGAISFSGQNNRYNSFYVDGALQNDVFGLSANGMYGGQTGNIPVPIEAIEQLQVQLSPYDASMGGYTGAAINMITKSGKNQPFSSIYRYMRGNKVLYNNTGLIMSGPIKINRLLYFFNIDFLREANENKYDLNNYEGVTKNAVQFKQFEHSIKTNYNYDPGILNNIQQINALKFLLKIDYIISKRNAIIFSARSQISDKTSSGISANRNLYFSNNGKFYTHQNISGSIEWKHQWRKNNGNSLLFSLNNSRDQTSHLGKAFPSVSILDGNGLIFLGSNEDAMQSNVQQTNINILQKNYFTKRKHFITAGFELEFNAIKNQFLQNAFGSYFYFNITDFLLNRKPGDYQINFYKEGQNKASFFQFFNSSIFINDQINIHKNIRLMGGVRITSSKLLTIPITDSFTQKSAFPTFANYYDLVEINVNQTPTIPISVSPRLNIIVQFPKQKTTVEIGTGIFSGRMPLAWLAGINSNNGLKYGSFEASPQQLNQIRFQKNIHQQWMPNQFGVSGNRGVLNLVAEKLNMPSVWRSSFQITKLLKNNWAFQLEAMYYYNKDAIKFTNINLLPPTEQLIGPDNRLVYATLNNARIPLLPDSSNPFTHVILLSNNNNNENGYGYRWGFQVKNENVAGHFTFNYAFGKSFAAYDGNYSVLINQWRLNEQVNGRNNIGLAVSDFSAGHRFNFIFFKDWRINKKNKVGFSLMYNGSSGNRFSYVYGKKTLVRDDENSTGFELIYIPTSEQLKEQYFQPIISNDFYFTAEQQKEAFEIYIENNLYLKSNRGKYAQRNGSITPFVHRVDCRIASYSTIRLNKRKYGIAFSLDVFNLTNLLKQSFGKSYAVAGNRFKVLDFVGFLNPTQLIPMYNFNPINLTITPWQEQISMNPHFSSNWTAQIGCKINFY